MEWLYTELGHQETDLIHRLIFIRTAATTTATTATTITTTAQHIVVVVVELVTVHCN